MTISSSGGASARDAASLFDVLVIGGGPAGGAAAAILARAGRRVLLLEKETHAHHKVCGEFISGEAQYYLQELGIDLHALGAKPVEHVCIVHGAKVSRTALPFGAVSLSRYVLDEQILQVAMKCGAEIKRGTTVAGLEQARDGWKVHVARDESAETFFAHAIFLATGKHDLRGWQRPPSIQNDLVGLKMHFRLGSPEPEPEGNHRQDARQGDRRDDWRDVVIALFDSGYAGLEMIEEGRINLCLVISKRRFGMLNHSWELLLDELVRRTPMLAERLRGAKPCVGQAACDLRHTLRFCASGKIEAVRSIQVGRSNGRDSFFFGNGMSIALHSAFLAAENYLHANESRYHRVLAAELSPKLYPAAILSRMMVASLMQPALFWACRTFPPLVGAAASSTRLEIVR